jgi:hypothetical protein
LVKEFLSDCAAVSFSTRAQLRGVNRAPTDVTANFADDTAVLATDSDPAIGSQKLQSDLLAIQNWFKTWRMKVNEWISIHVTFTTRRET